MVNACFPWLFMSHQGLFRLTNPLVTCERSFGGYFWLYSEFVFLDCLWDNRGRVGWRIHSSPVKRSFWSYFWLSNESVFVDCLWVNRGCGGWRIHSSLVKRVLRATDLWAAIPFVTCEKSFWSYFWLSNESVFVDCLWVNRGCGGWRIHSSLVKRVSRATD